MGDREIEIVFEQITPMLYRIARHYLDGYADQQDAVQNCLCKAWESRKRIRNTQYVETWIIRILMNECINIWRNNQKLVMREEVGFQDFDVNKMFSHMELHRAINKLQDEEKAVISYRFFGEYKMREIAEITGESLGTVQAKLYRSLRHLARLIPAS